MTSRAGEGYEETHGVADVDGDDDAGGVDDDGGNFGIHRTQTPIKKRSWRALS